MKNYLILAAMPIHLIGECLIKAWKQWSCKENICF